MEYMNYLRDLTRESKIGFGCVQNKEIILYGAGNLGILAIETLRDGGVAPKFIVDKSKKGDLLGLPIKGLDDLSEEDKMDCIFLICISTLSYNGVSEQLHQAGIKKLIHFYTYAYLVFPDIISNGWILSDEDYGIDRASKVCRMIEHDDKSIAHYITFLYWKRFNQEVLFDGYGIETGNKYFKCDIMPELTEEETFLDIGCYEGNIIEKFVVVTKGEFDKIIGIDIAESFLVDASERFRDDKRISFQCCAISDYNGISYINDRIGMACHLDETGEKAVDVKTVDSMNEKPTIIKVHIEGSEYQALRGAKNTIRDMRPVLMVMADHNTDGWYNIPAFMEELDGYQLYFRLHDYCGNSAVWYYIPCERGDC